MQRKWLFALASATVIGILTGASALAAPPWQAMLPFKRVEADPNKQYLLTDDHGPWLIMCRAFAGETAQQDAHALVLELRQRYKLKAYLHEQQYDFTQKERGKGFDRYGAPKVMKPANPSQFVEVAVLVGDFDGPEDPKADSILDSIKTMHPECLDVKKGSGKSARFNVWRGITAKMDGKGPMKLAFLTRNPRLPDEYFAPKGIDPLVKEMNRDLKYSLLKNPGNYSVRIATFSGESKWTVKTKEIEAQERASAGRSKLEEGADKAHKLVQHLRNEGIEAYEFHERHESIVTVGSFDSVGEPRPDGKIEINPAVRQVVDYFRPKDTPAGGRPTGAQKIAGVTLDIQPTPVAVPKESIGAAYARGTRD